MTSPSLLVLGSDAVLAAAPGTPVQLAHACRAAGYRAVIPATWGDELIAARVLQYLGRTNGPVLQVTCPMVVARLATHGNVISPMLFSAVAPPIATALYLRALYSPARPRITFGGGCPSAEHESIDVRLSVDDLMGLLAERQISILTQPMEFDSILPPDRRRFYSEPGGIPSVAWLRQLDPPAELVELGHEDFTVELAQALLTTTRTLLDVAPSLGCACSGARAGMSAERARSRVRDVEPPRAFAAVVDHAVPLPLEVGRAPQAIVPAASPAVNAHALPGPASNSEPAALSPAPAAHSPEPAALAIETPRRPSPSGPSRAVHGMMPQARSTGGGKLPRAYVARRRSSPIGIRASAMRREFDDAGTRPSATRWLVVGGVGVALGLGIAWVVLVLL